MDIDPYLEDTLIALGAIYHEMAAKIEAPMFVDVGGYRAWRYLNLSEALACFLKGVKVVSTLNASMVLLRAGFVQEIGALCRMVDDYCNEIFFLLLPQDAEKYSKDQIQFLEDFFQEEFDKPTNPLAATQKRVNVPARKVHATFGKLTKTELDPADTQEMLRTTHQALSGYVHGAYPHIMEMFGGVKPHLNGMLGTPRMDEWRRQLIGYTYRALMVSVLVARKLGLDETDRKVRKLLEEFETGTGSKPAQTAADMLRKMKKRS
ncbi:MAG: hypothetical protein ABSH41_14845 [Syntrophobacteraceae bacterium]